MPSNFKFAFFCCKNFFFDRRTSPWKQKSVCMLGFFEKVGLSSSLFMENDLYSSKVSTNQTLSGQEFSLWRDMKFTMTSIHFPLTLFWQAERITGMKLTSSKANVFWKVFWTVLKGPQEWSNFGNGALMEKWRIFSVFRALSTAFSIKTYKHFEKKEGYFAHGKFLYWFYRGGELLDGCVQEKHEKWKRKLGRRNMDSRWKTSICGLYPFQQGNAEFQTAEKVNFHLFRASKIFKQMSQFIGTRCPSQCRSQNQKMYKRFKTVNRIVTEFKK